MESQSFLVTGGCGLQGSSIVSTLRKRYPNARISVLTRSPTVNLFDGVKYYKGDITRPSDIETCLAACKPTVVFHCAAAIVVARKHVPDAIVHNINVNGTKLVLEKCKALGTVRAFVFTSSVSVVQRPGVKINGADETWAMINPEADKADAKATIYPRTKAEAERLVSAADDQRGMRTCSLRPSAIYGERDNDVTPLIMRTARMRSIQIGDNSNQFLTTYVGNSTHAHLLAAEKLLSRDPAVRDSVGGQAFFVTNEDRYTYWDFARTIWFYAGAGPARDSAEYRTENLRVVSSTLALWAAWLSEWYGWARGTQPPISQIGVAICTMTRVYDISKAKEVLGYREQTSWEEGCERAARWWLENKLKD